MNTKTIASSDEQEMRSRFFELYKKNPIPDKEQLSNIGLFMKRKELTKILFFQELYAHILLVHGVIMEFGVRWGQNLVTLTNLRGIYEPFNYSRKIIGFDTFEGFPSVHEKDGTHQSIEKGAFNVTENYEKYLQKTLDYHTGEAPLNHIPKNELVKGDAVLMLEKYLKEHPEKVIAMAYFDFDIYEPTKKCLELIKPYLTKGAVIGFDEVGDPRFPGETIAVKETFGIENISLRRFRYGGIQSYIIIE